MIEKLALLSVSNKKGLIPFAQGLIKCGYQIISTGGTLKSLKQADIPVMAVSEYTGAPEIMDGRVKTLHPKIHAGILARRDNEDHLFTLKNSGYNPIDIVVVNLYPFVETVANPGVSLDEAIENIDIGGPTMVRAAAKNHSGVTVIVHPEDYPTVLTEIEAQGHTTLALRQQLAVKAFKHTADYDSAIDEYLSKTLANAPSLRLHFENGERLRYGENSHQSAFFYKDVQYNPGESSIGNAKQLHGKELSFNNLVDADAALEICKDLWDAPAVVVIKHTNPCGMATGKTLAEAFNYAWEGDPVSAFGSIIAFSRIVELDTAQLLKGRFVELVIAPGYTSEALEFLRSKSKDLRILEIGSEIQPVPQKMMRHIIGGMLVQDRDILLAEKWETVTEQKPNPSLDGTARFAWTAAKHVKSNAITLAWSYAPGQYMLMGMGPGQPNRIDSNLRLCQPRLRDNATRMAKEKGLDADVFVKKVFSESVLASDAFFPFDDNVHAANEAGIKTIVQPGGSKADPQVIETANKLGISMIFTGTRHFRH